MPLGIDPMPFGIIRESQRDSAPKPRVASRELPWEERVVSANPNGVAARWQRGDTTPLGLKSARTLPQGSLADSATLGWRTQSLWDCRATGLSGVPYGNTPAGMERGHSCPPGFDPMPFGYSVRGHCPTERRKDRWSCNPKGIVSSSPATESARLPWVGVRAIFNPVGVGRHHPLFPG